MLRPDHAALIVSKEENLKFYEDLGFHEVKRITRAYYTVVFMGCDGVLLEIFVDPKHPERPNAPEALGLRHIAFTVDNLDDVNPENKPIQTDWFGRRYIFLQDPDGQTIEINEKNID